MEPGNLDAKLAVYVPNWVRALLATPAGAETHGPHLNARTASVLFLDIVGFTGIADQFARFGDRGAEHLSDFLNDCFAELVEVAVVGHGGDLVSFAGDGFLLVWDRADLRTSSLRAVRCAVALRDRMRTWTRSRGATLTQRIIVDAGELHYCKMGGYKGQWRYLVAGDPFLNIRAGAKAARAGDIVLCESAFRHLSGLCVGEQLDSGFRLVKLHADAPSEAPQLPEIALASYASLVPEVVHDRYRVADGSWLAEFRSLSVLAINLLRGPFEASLLGHLQAAVLQIQKVTGALQGAIINVLMDDKGLCVWLAFGLPPLAHEDDAFRAIQTALKICEDPAGGSVRPSIGVASGKLFCGDCGGKRRRDYGVFGQAMNVAARLAEAADGGVLCDTATAFVARERVEFSPLSLIRIKGRAEPIATYRPMRLYASQRPPYAGEIIGRERERSELRTRVAALREGVGGFVILEGPAGIGKSRLVNDFAGFADTEGLLVLRGHAAAIERSTPYFAWRAALARLAGGGSGASLHDALQDRLGDAPALQAWLPLLGDILPIGTPESPLTMEITGAARAASIETLVVALIEHFASAPAILIFEDMHWFDTASWTLLEGVLSRIPKLLVVGSRRRSNRPDAVQPKGAAEAVIIEVGDLAPDEVSELLRRRLRATGVPPGLLRFVTERAGGNPLFCEELASALQDTNVIAVSPSGVATELAATEAAKLTSPMSLEGAIVARVDALPAEAQLLLKGASAISEPFDIERLRDAFQSSSLRLDFGQILNQLVAREFLVVKSGESALKYEFRHAINEAVIYRLLPFAQRRQLHSSIAAAIERRQADHLEAYFGQLARHWERAEDFPRAISYLGRAAERALRGYANRDAIGFIQKAIELTSNERAESSNATLSRWETILGDAHSELAEYEDALVHYERALGYAGETLPGSLGARALSLVGNLAGQTRLRLLRPAAGGLSPETRARSERIAHIRERLAERHFFRNETIAVLDETLAALNHAERCGAVAETISGYSALALGLGMSGMRASAHFYRRRALGLAEESGSSSAAARAFLLAAVYGYGTGEWGLTESCASRSLALYRELGDSTRAPSPLTVQIFSALLRGEIARAEALLPDLDSATARDSTGQGKAWDLAAGVLIALIRGRVDRDAVDLLREAASSKLIRADRLLCLGIAASAYGWLGDGPRAWNVASDGLMVLKETGTVWGSYVYGVSGIVSVLIDAAPKSEENGRFAREAMRHARRATRASAVCRPQSLLMRGRLNYLSARPRRARRLWQKAAAAAERLGMRRDYGLALYEIGRTSPPGDALRPQYLLRAAEIFETLGAQSDLQSTHEALAFSP
jgi:class 3 adenylate cyclase/tetratricopeptide (TPR) repeat protein